MQSANRLRPGLGALLVLLLATSACWESTQCCVDPSVIAQVLGQVTSTAGEPVADALVRVSATQLQNPDYIYARESLTTDVEGRFQLLLAAFLLPPATTDVLVEIVPSAGAGLAAKTLAGLTLDFSYPPPKDTLAISAQLEAQ